MPLDPATGVFYELHGQGQPLLVGLPLMASHVEIFGEASAALLAGYLDRLADRYRVLLVDYPGIGRSRDILPAPMTADRVCSDLLGVATAAGFERFAWWGYSWSGAVGLQLATRSDRLTALAIGGWPPLDAPYASLLRASRGRVGNVPASAMAILRSAAQYAQWPQFYASIEGWPETAAVEAIGCPRMVYFGADGDLVEDGEMVPIASTIRGTRDRLQALGWTVLEIPGRGHDVCLSPELVVPPVRAFLDATLPAAAA